MEAGGVMAEVGRLPFARIALQVPKAGLPRYRSRFSKPQFTQPQLLAILCLMRYEDWTFREAEVRLGESAMRALFGGEASSLSAAASPAEPERNAAVPVATKPAAANLNALITGAAKDLVDYQRLTAEGKLAEAGQKLEQVKHKLANRD